MSYKLLIFDLGKVMLDFNHLDSCKRLSNFSPYSPLEIYQRIFVTGLEKDYDEGKISSREFYQEVLKRLEIKSLEVNFEDFKRIWGDIFFEIPFLDKLMNSLKKNYQIYLLSNTNEIHFNWVCQKFEILKIPEEYILSFQLGYRKPDKRIFYEAVNKAKVSPKECIYIDDIKEFVEVAGSIGITGIHFKSKEELEKDLKALGVIF
ncbi:HAD family phosphatase [bacterium]|nr:HAD family phosphatase [bacterium]